MGVKMKLIDADALVEDISKEIDEDKAIYPDDKVSIIFRAGIKTVIRIVKNQDSVDPVKHGHWIHGSSSENIRVTCSECGYKVNYFWDSWQDAKYCPNCGAKMGTKE